MTNSAKKQISTDVDLQQLCWFQWLQGTAHVKSELFWSICCCPLPWHCYT